MRIYCDVCMDETEHEQIKKDTFRCRSCGSVVKVNPERDVEIKAIISTGELSEVGRVKVKEGEDLRVGDELIFEDGEYRVGEIRALELKDGRRVEVARAGDVRVVWLRNVSEVFVKFSLHKGAVTTPYKMVSSGETEFEVGERINIDNCLFRITRIKTFDGRVLKRGKAKAKEIKRIYAKFERKL